MECFCGFVRRNQTLSRREFQKRSWSQAKICELSKETIKLNHLPIEGICMWPLQLFVHRHIQFHFEGPFLTTHEKFVE
jgi:hypothetical protein